MNKTKEKKSLKHICNKLHVHEAVANKLKIFCQAAQSIPNIVGFFHIIDAVYVKTTNTLKKVNSLY